jgi:hypothetical protein
MTCPAETVVMHRLKAQRLVARIFDGDVTAVEFDHSAEHAVGAVHGLAAFPASGGDGAIETQDPDGIDDALVLGGTIFNAFFIPAIGYFRGICVT